MQTQAPSTPSDSSQPWLESPPPARWLFCNRTLNLRRIGAIGYDMDYTLIHYRVEEWERLAYEYTRDKLGEQGWPVENLEFDPDFVIRGLIIDTELGNILKANRFGYVKRAFHGTRPLDHETQREVYSRTIVELTDSRYVFLNTLFSISEACIYAQLVDWLESCNQPGPGEMSYASLYRRVKSSLDETHLEGRLKQEIIGAPERFVELDPEGPLALLDQKRAGKKLMLITNSEWSYTSPIMDYAFNPYLPPGMTWRELFDVVLVSARKPDFFMGRAPLFEIINDEGHLKPCLSGLRDGGVFLGGNANHVEEYLGLSGDQILYVGDHLYGDVHVSKSLLRWRTVFIARELEAELEAVQSFEEKQVTLRRLMQEKKRLESLHCQLRLALQRLEGGFGPSPDESPEVVEKQVTTTRQQLARLDEEISPLAQSVGKLHNPNWGLLMRAGNDKSYFARQIERHADVYTSRVSNFLFATPFVYLRSPRGSLPHDPLSPDSTQPMPASSEDTGEL